MNLSVVVEPLINRLCSGCANEISEQLCGGQTIVFVVDEIVERGTRRRKLGVFRLMRRTNTMSVAGHKGVNDGLGAAFVHQGGELETAKGKGEEGGHN